MDVGVGFALARTHDDPITDGGKVGMGEAFVEKTAGAAGEKRAVGGEHIAGVLVSPDDAGGLKEVGIIRFQVGLECVVPTERK